MADTESANGEAPKTSNGAMSSLDADKAAYLAGDLGEETAEEKPAPAKDAEVDEDADLDESDEEEASTDDDDEPDESEDDDSDLDDDEDEKPAAKPDAETAKRIEQVRKTDKRLREQRERQFSAREQQINSVIEQWKPRVEKAERFEAMKAQARYRLVDIARDEFGISEDDFEEIARDFYAHSKKGGEDPKNKEAVAKSRRERELADRLTKAEKILEEREAADKRSQEEAKHAAEVARFIDSVASVASKSEKLVLTKQYLAKNPERARSDMERIASQLYANSGEVPSNKAVAKALEKERRGILRDLGIDPKAATAKDASTHKADTKPVGKTVNGKKAAAKPVANDEKPLSREAYIRGDFD